MRADYIANPLYENTPFIEALPPMLAGKDLIRALASIPPYSDNDRDRSTGERLQLLSSLYEYYQPLLRYCPICYQEDLAQYGEPYWHRSHQLPDMQLCVKHHCWLVDTDAVCVHNRQGELFPATFAMHLAQPPTASIPDSLFALHQLLQDTIDAPFDFKDGTVYYDVIDRALLSHGWRSPTGGHTYAAKVGSALLNLYGTSIPAGDISAKQLHATLSHKSVAPRYILQLAVLFGLSLSEPLTSPRGPAPDYKKEMQEMYRAGVSMYHIAQLYGTDAKTVARWVK